MNALLLLNMISTKLKGATDNFFVSTYPYEVNVDHQRLDWFPISLEITVQYGLPPGTKPHFPRNLWENEGWIYGSASQEVLQPIRNHYWKCPTVEQSTPRKS